MSQLGRISGPLLKANLLRQGVDLAFETDLLYLDVNNRRIGIKTATPSHELQVNGTTRTTNLEVTGSTAQIGDFLFSPNTITYDGDLTFNLPEGSALRTSKFSIDSIDIFNNIIATNESNANLEIRPSGTGIIDIKSGVQVAGDLQVDGAITADGNIVLGDATTDTITFNAEINSNIIPDANEAYNIGSNPITGGKRWYDVWTRNLYADIITSQNLIIDGVNISALPGNMLYVSAVNGNDSHQGEHPNDSLRTLKYALSIAPAGTTIYLYPGVYEEAFPLEVPVGVTVKGTGIRSVRIVPTTATEYNDCFLMNGETTVEDLTVADFYSGGNYFTVTSAAPGTTTVDVGTSPFAHAYVSGGTIEFIDSSSGNITGATYTHTTGVLVLTHTGGTASLGDRVFLSNLTFSCNGGNRVFPDNGYAFRFATDFEVTTRSPYVRNISVLTKGTIVGVGDPLGFGSADAGKGAYVDGAYATATSREASMLFHSVTFITPSVDALSATNGARVEWLNSFTYYANKGMSLFSSNDGFAGDGKTRIKISNTTGTWQVGDTISYYDTDGTTVLASGIIESIDGDFYNIDGKSLGWETPEDRIGKTVSLGGDAKLSTAQKKFGTASLVLDGTTDFASIASQPDFAFGTGDFCMEGWFYPTTTGTYRTLFDLRTSGVDGGGIILGLNDVNQLYFYYNFGYRIGAAGTVPLNQWTHIALARSSGVTKAFVNGTQIGSNYTDTNNYAQRAVRIGADPTGNFAFTGYIDDIRISKGVPRYSSSFIAPTAAFTSDTSTVLLLHFNGTNNSTIVVDDGITTQDLRSSSLGTATLIDLADYSDFGAELRSIGSACVYGNYGAYGDGDGVIAYLIGQNLAYIGNGGDSNNDPTTVIQANEVVETNRAKIYYTSVDHKGDFRVGDQFYINQDTGEVIFSNSNVAVTGSLLFNDGVNQTYIDATKIETGDFRISNNTVETLTQVMNINSFTGEVNFLNNVNIAGDLDVTGNVTIGGNITIGDQTTDSVNIEARIDSDIIPKLNDTYDLGTTVERWRQIFVNRLTADNIEIVDNKISTLDSNSDLELSAAGTGKVLIPSNNLQVNDTFTVLGTTNLQTTNIVGALNLTGNSTITGDVIQNGDLSVSGSFFAASLDLENIEIVQNNIRTKNSNQDLQLEAAGTGKIYVPSNDVQIDQDLTVDGQITGVNINNTGTVTSTTIRNENIVINSNTITTTLSNSDLELRSNGTGKIYVSASDVQIDEDLEVIGNTNLAVTNIAGTLTVNGNIIQVGNYTQTGDLSVTGNISVGNAAQFENVLIDDNFITTTISNSDLELRAAGTGKVIVDGTDLEVTGDLVVVGDISSNTLNVATDITADRYTNGNILIENNVISTTDSNSDLELRANGTGIVSVTSDLYVNQDLTVIGVTTLLGTTDVTGVINHTGDLNQTGTTTHTGDYTLTGNLTVTSYAQFEDIRIDGNQLYTTDSNSNLELFASGSGIISVPSNDVTVGQDLTVNGTLTVENLSLTILQTEIVQTSDVRIQNNFITTTLSNSDLELRANGTGNVVVPDADVLIQNDITVSGITDLQNTDVTGTLTQIGNTNHTGNTTQTGDYTLNGNLDVSGLTEIADIRINGNQISSANGFNLVLDAPGSGIIYVPENDVLIENDLFVNGTLYANNVVGTFGSLQSNEIDTGDIVVRGNRITTTLSNSDLELRANGTGSVVIDNTDLIVNGGLVVTTDVQLNNTQITGTLTHNGVANHTGTVNQTGDYDLTGNMNITGTAQFSNIRVEGNVIRTTTPGSDLTFQATGGGIITVPFNNVEIAQNLTVSGDITTTDIVASGSVTAPIINLGSITISGNLITTNTSNTNLELRANGTGGIELESVIVNQNQISTLTDTNLIIAPNGTGIVDFQGTQAVRLPRGTEAQRPTGQAGYIRYNTDDNYYEGFDGTNWRRLDGVYDLDENTYITPETTPGANDNVISFYINGLNRATLNATQFSTSNVDIGNINITGNTISTTNTDGNLILAPNGTGSTVIGVFAIRNNTITNTQNDAITSFNQTGTGYFKINGTNGFVLPRGSDIERGVLFETGMMRYNTTDQRVEVYDGVTWVSAAGSSGTGITYSEAEGLAITTALIFG